MSSFDDGFSSSQPSMCWPNDAQDFLSGSLEEDFFCRIRSLDDGWENKWVKSEWKKDENMAGEWNYTSGSGMETRMIKVSKQMRTIDSMLYQLSSLNSATKIRH